MATRNTTASASAAKATVVDTPFVETLHATHEQEEQDLIKRAQDAVDALLAKMRIGTTKRGIIGFMLGLVATMGVSYLMAPMVHALAFAALIGTGSLFLACAVFFIGVLITMFTAANVGTCVSTYIASGTAERHISEAKGWVTSLFSSRKPAAR